MVFWSVSLHITTSQCGAEAGRKWTVSWAKITNYRGREDEGPAKHASFNEPVTEAGLSSINTMSMCMHAHVLAYTPICLHTEHLTLSHPYSGMHEWEHARTHMLQTKAAAVHFLINISLRSLYTSSWGTSQCCVAWYCHLDTKQYPSKQLWTLYDFIRKQSPS